MVVALTLTLAFFATRTIEAGPHDLDFWLGSWKCAGESHGPGGKTSPTQGENDVTRILKENIIQENFKGQGLIGMSVSAFNPRSKTWHQTWVDDQGSYIALTGGKVGKEFVLTTIPKATGRMTFTNITEKGFDWNWESSADEGKTWALRWHIRYTRK